jgi:hypothetical protein
MMHLILLNSCKSSGPPNVLLAALDMGLGDVLVDAEFCPTQAVLFPAQYLGDYKCEADSTLISLVARVCRVNAGACTQEDETFMASLPMGRKDDREVDRALELVDRLHDRWNSFSYAATRKLRGLKTALVGWLILHGGSGMLPLADKLLNAGFKLEPDAQDSCPLVALVVDHYYRRCWVEKQLELPNTRAMDAMRHALLWLSEKTGDKLQINWQPP